METGAPTRVSKIIHRHRKPIAEMITKKLKATDWDNRHEVSRLYSWLNGIAVPETHPDVRRELLKLRATVGQYGK